MSYVYDEFNRIKGVKYGTETTPRYEYDYNAKGQSAWVKDNQLSRVTQSEYDLADRPCRVTLRQNGSHMVTAEAAYDPVKGLLTKFTERIGTNYSRYETTYGYDDERRPSTISYGSTNDQTKYTYDALGRITKRTVKVGGYSYNSTMSYLAGGYGDNSTTGLVSQISQTGRTHVYTYNDVGSIATDRYGGKTTRYTYDGIGQLVRVDDPHDTTVTNGTTWVYEYDRGGNLTKKKSYRHTTGDLDTSPESTINLTYGATAWKDKLTAYAGTTITYDAIGNPLSDGTWTYTWTNGRQLQGMTKTGTSASFLYNDEGLRVRKTVGSAVTHYFWHGGKVTYMVRGSEVLYFWYDGEGRPAIVAYNGTKYAYVYSLQGDVLALINSSGTEVVGYNYNAWGETLSVTGTLAATLGNIQPFRYRGYIYDYETGLYYLKSRYYNPVWCRFINADSLIKGNLFCYCINNPICKYDINGYDAQDCNDTITGLYETTFLAHAWCIAYKIGRRAIINKGITIDMTKEYEVIEPLEKYGVPLDFISKSIAQGACDAYYEIENEEFILSDDCVANEILEHIILYGFSIGKRMPDLLTYGYFVYNKISFSRMYSAAKTMDIRIRDVNNKGGIFSQAEIFRYKQGIRQQYIGTDRYPWANER